MVRLMQDVTGVTHFPCTKLVSNLRDKTRYVTYYRCLQFYLALGLVLDKIHRVVASTQRTYMLPFIKFYNDGRKNTKSEFESLLYKLIANAFYGKTVENIRKRANVRMIADPAKFVRSVSKASNKRSSIINADLAMVENFRAKAILSKPIVVGCTILEFAKRIMYEFYYNCLLPTFGDRLHLCFTDMDSFVCYVESDDLVGAIPDQYLNTSNFEHTHPLYSSTNFCALGKFKSETADVPPTEFCGLRSKMYSLSTITSDREYRKANGVPKSYVKKHVTHEQYLHVLRHLSRTWCTFHTFLSRNHRVTTRIMSKVCLSLRALRGSHQVL